MAITTARSDFSQTYESPTGIGRLAAVNHKPVGMRFFVTALVFFVLGGIFALLIRLQLAVPESGLIDPQTYNEFFTMHGTTMMFLFAVPFLEGLASYLLPLQLGARDLPFPRLNAFNYWCYLFGGILLYSSFVFGLAPDGGWFAYPPLTGLEFTPDLRQDFWLLGISFVEIAAIGAAIEIIVLILKMRPVGMPLSRMPLFAWSMLVTSFMILFAFTPLLVGSIMFELDRKIGTLFFAPVAGGDPLLWQHIFWFFGHPEVYIMFLPAAGIVSMIIPVFCRRPIAGYVWIAAATVAIGFISFGLWVHHMYAVGLPMLSMSFFGAASMIIAIPSGVQVFAWIATLATGRIVWTTPLLYVVGFIVIFVLGGITGVMVASVPFDLQVHDSFFVVAHFHYVLVGGVVFPVVAGLYFWWPKITGRMPSERWGRVSFWLAFVGFNVAFFPQHILGLLGMPRRVYTYQPGLGWERDNMLSTVGAFLLAAGFLVTLVNLIWTRVRGAPAGSDPWNADSLEWTVPSPPPAYNFETMPLVSGRHPKWEDEEQEMYSVPEREPWGLTGYPSGWRGSLGTSMLTSRPEQVVRLPMNSYWPLVAAVGVLVLLVGVLVDVFFLIPAGALVLFVGLLAWVRSDERVAVPDEEVADRGLAIHTTGEQSVQWTGMVLAVLVAVVALGTFLTSFVYLRGHDVPWPPPGVARPDILWPAVAAGLAILAAPAAAWAARGRGDATRTKIGLWPVIVLGLASIVAQSVGFAVDYPGITPDEHVYASLVYVIPGLQASFVALGVLLAGIALARAISLPHPQRVHMLADNAALWWLFVAASAVLTFVTVHLLVYVL